MPADERVERDKNVELPAGKSPDDSQTVAPKLISIKLPHEIATSSKSPQQDEEDIPAHETMDFAGGRTRAETIEEQINELVSYEESGCLCCKRFFCNDERNVSVDALILEKDRLNVQQLLNYERTDRGGTFEHLDVVHEAKRKNCLKVLAEAALSVNCLKLPFAQFKKLSARTKTMVISVQILWISFLILYFTVNKYQFHNCVAHPILRPNEDYSYGKYHCLVKSQYFSNQTLSDDELQFQRLRADPKSGWNSTLKTLEEFKSWKTRTKFHGPVEYMEIFTTLCDRGISVAAMYMFHTGTYTEALYPPMLDETFFPGAGTTLLAVRRPRKYIQQVAVAFLATSQFGALVYAFLADVCVKAPMMGTLGSCFLSTFLSWQYFTSSFTVIGFLVGGLFVQLHNSTVVSNCLQADWATNIERVESTKKARGSTDHLLKQVSSEIRNVLTPKLSRASIYEIALKEMDTTTAKDCDSCKVHNEDTESHMMNENENDSPTNPSESNNQLNSYQTSQTHSVEIDAWGALYKKVISCLHVWSWRWSPTVLSIIIYLVFNMVKDFTLLTRDFVLFGGFRYDDKIIRFSFELVLLITFLWPIVYIDVFYRRLRVLVALHKLEWTENFERLHQGHAAFTLFDFPIRVEFALQGLRVLFLTIFVVIVGMIASEAREVNQASTTTVEIG